MGQRAARSIRAPGAKPGRSRVARMTRSLGSGFSRPIKA
jgi:hypothetical protein